MPEKFLKFWPVILTFAAVLAASVRMQASEEATDHRVEVIAKKVSEHEAQLSAVRERMAKLETNSDAILRSVTKIEARVYN